MFFVIACYSSSLVTFSSISLEKTVKKWFVDCVVQKYFSHFFLPNRVKHHLERLRIIVQGKIILLSVGERPKDSFAKWTDTVWIAMHQHERNMWVQDWRRNRWFEDTTAQDLVILMWSRDAGHAERLTWDCSQLQDVRITVGDVIFHAEWLSASTSISQLRRWINGKEAALRKKRDLDVMNIIKMHDGSEELQGLV